MGGGSSSSKSSANLLNKQKCVHQVQFQRDKRLQLKFPRPCFLGSYSLRFGFQHNYILNFGRYLYRNKSLNFPVHSLRVSLYGTYDQFFFFFSNNSDAFPNCRGLSDGFPLKLFFGLFGCSTTFEQFQFLQRRMKRSSSPHEPKSRFNPLIQQFFYSIALQTHFTILFPTLNRSV